MIAIAKTNAMSLGMLIITVPTVVAFRRYGMSRVLKFGLQMKRARFSINRDMPSVTRSWLYSGASNTGEMRKRSMQLLQKENELQEIIQLVGPDALPPKEQAVLEGARAIREDFLQQNAFHEIDTYCPAKKQYEMMRIMLHYYDLLDKAVEKGVSMERMKAMKCRESIGRMATVDNDNFEGAFTQIEDEIVKEIASQGGD